MTEVHPTIRPLFERVKALRDALAPIDAFPEARVVRARLDRALDRLAAPQPPQAPFKVVLVGGTGSGKSRLFSALVGRENASPSSDTERCYTRTPFAAVHPDDRALVEFPPAWNATVGPGPAPGVVLIDTPDVDGVLLSNREVARELINFADLVLFVAEPDKRSNFDLHQEVRDWAVRKRWFFAMNKIDWYEQHAESIRRDFAGRLKDLGLGVDPRTLFLVSALHPDRYEFPALREAVFRPRGTDATTLLKGDVFLRDVHDALKAPLPEALEERGGRIRAASEELRQKVHLGLREALRNPDAAEAFRLMAREAGWRNLAPRAGWFMALPVWLRCRFALLWAGYQVSRLTSRGLSVLGVFGAVAASSFAAARGMLPTRQIVQALGPSYRRTLKDVQNDTRRLFEDHGLDGLLKLREEVADEPVADDPQVPATVKALGSLFRRFLLPDADADAMANLSHAIDRVGQSLARRVGGGVTKLIANLLPAGMIGWVLYRIGLAWYTENYLPLNFYGMAAALIVASFLPGFFLLSLALRRRSDRLDPAAEIETVEAPPALGPLRIALDHLDELARNARQLRDSLPAVRELLEQEGGLSPEAFGVAGR